MIIVLSHPPRAQFKPKGRGHFVISFLLINLFLALATSAFALEFTTDEDRSRFVERLYEKAEPGLRPPAEYVAIAKKAAHSQFSDIALAHFSDGIVSRRTYRNAPKTDRDIICVSFVYKGSIGGGGLLSSDFVWQHEAPDRPILVVQMRPDLSKIYVNIVHFKRK